MFNYGLLSPVYDLQPHIGGPQPVLYLYIYSAIFWRASLSVQLCCSVVGVDNDVDVDDNIVDVTVCQLTICSDGAVEEVKVDVKLERTLPHCGSCVLRSGSVPHDNCS